MKINGNEIEFTKEAPQKEGKFLWKGVLSNSLQLITVYYHAECDNYGMHWEAYYGVSELRGRNVAALRGEFAEITEIES
jgi:hypothetical protein